MSEWPDKRLSIVGPDDQAPKPVAWVCLDMWRSGDYWPNDCFGNKYLENSVPLYLAPPSESALRSLADQVERQAEALTILDGFKGPPPTKDQWDTICALAWAIKEALAREAT